jgi:hypothetical protein
MYVTRAAKPLFVETPLWDDQRAGMNPSLSVDGAREVDTGLINADGDSIWRVQPPIGFGRDEEW